MAWLRACCLRRARACVRVYCTRRRSTSHHTNGRAQNFHGSGQVGEAASTRVGVCAQAPAASTIAPTTTTTTTTTTMRFPPPWYESLRYQNTVLTLVAVLLAFTVAFALFAGSEYVHRALVPWTRGVLIGAGYVTGTAAVVLIVLHVMYPLPYRRRAAAFPPSSDPQWVELEEETD